MADIENAHAEAQKRARITLQVIADTLQVPIQAFTGQADQTDALSELAALSELIELWNRLHGDMERAQVLTVARELIERRTGP